MRTFGRAASRLRAAVGATPTDARVLEMQTASVPRTPSCGVNDEPPAGIVLIPTPKLPSPCWKIAGSTTVAFGLS